MGAYDPRIAQPGQTQVNLPNGFALQPAMTNGFAQQGPAPMPPQPNPMRQAVPQPGIPQGPMPGQPAPNPMLAGADMQQPGMPSMLDRLMSPAGQIGLSMMAQGPSLTPVNPMAGIGTALGNSMQYQRQKQADAVAAEDRAYELQQREAKAQAAARQRAFWDRAGMPELADAPAEVQQAAIKRMMGDPDAIKTSFDRADKLRDDFRKDTETVRKVYEGAQVVDALKDNDNGISDRALIIAFSKIMDPTSAVLEGEAAAVRNAAGFLPGLSQSILAAFGEGGQLTEDARRQIAEVARIQANARLQEAAPTYERYERMADRYQVPWEEVNTFGDMTAKDLAEYRVSGTVDPSQLSVRPITEGSPLPADPSSLTVSPQRAPTPQFNPNAPQNARRLRRAGQRENILEAD